ncbi:MAG: tRNA ligase [Anaerolineae bacterium]|nr:tRNA ligase [Anaerolineae bacterium]
MPEFKDLNFNVSPEVSALGIKNICFRMDGLTNRESDPQFTALAVDAMEKIHAGLTGEALKNDPILLEFRNIHSRIGFSNRDYVAASEALLLTLFKTGHLPQVNLLVDIYNLVSVETRLSLGAHDIQNVDGNIRLRLCDGSETFWPLGSAQPKTVRPGGYAYIDQANEVICMLEVRQVQKTKATLDTHDCFYIVQGNAQTPLACLEAATSRLIELTQRFCGGQAQLLYRSPSD